MRPAPVAAGTEDGPGGDTAIDDSLRQLYLTDTGVDNSLSLRRGDASNASASTTAVGWGGQVREHAARTTALQTLLAETQRNARIPDCFTCLHSAIIACAGIGTYVLQLASGHAAS
jgi:hypothetical protein